jgi:hypothetical protein
MSDVIRDARAAFDKWAEQFDPQGDEWQDMGFDHAFIMGYQSAIAAVRKKQSPVPDGYMLVRDTTPSLTTKKLSDKLQFWRAMRPDEWTMDELIQDAQQLEALLPNNPTD